MSTFMDRLMGRKPVTPAQSAKDRLKFVLITDRTTIAPEDLKKMQAEIIEVIKRYCRINDSDVELKFEQRERDSYLVADIPLKPLRSGEDGGFIRLETTLSPDDEEENIETKEVPATAIQPEEPLPDEKTEKLPRKEAPLAETAPTPEADKPTEKVVTEITPTPVTPDDKPTASS